MNNTDESLSLNPNDWENILDDIKAEKAVLLIGPEIMHFHNKPMNKYLRDQMYAYNQNDIAYYYKRDGVFLFKSPEGKVRVARNVRRFYENIQPDEQILEKIAKIPFHLIISVNPDRFLSDTFLKNGIKHRFYYFQNRERDNKNGEFERPTRAVPVIYNLFGYKDQDDSLILDYDDFYQLLKSLFGTPGLPDKFMKTFGDARTYIFIGFQFDKWYSQLIIKFLSDGRPREKWIAVKSQIKSNDIEGFIITEFKINLFKDQFDFFGKLYKKCEQGGILRELSSHRLFPTGISILQKLASTERLSEALDDLILIAKNKDWFNEVISLKQQYISTEEMLNSGTIESSNYSIKRNQIVDGILDIIKTKIHY